MKSILKLNPLWPHGMVELTEQEKALRAALPLNMDWIRLVPFCNQREYGSQEEAEEPTAHLLRGKVIDTAVQTALEVIGGLALPEAIRALKCSMEILNAAQIAAQTSGRRFDAAREVAYAVKESDPSLG